jgi:hypothetical protein
MLRYTPVSLKFDRNYGGENKHEIGDGSTKYENAIPMLMAIFIILDSSIVGHSLPYVDVKIKRHGA